MTEEELRDLEVRDANAQWVAMTPNQKNRMMAGLAGAAVRSRKIIDETQPNLFITYHAS